ncbi:hypothetical protein [Arthrobacter wenxiniae]|uniref:Uncharacterized protein n=1 Tax=Arthrobacter wenxiniae TaxID=2713570 RepID=A0A7Y7IET0_9MICC|nr:hypothetical protein [Arthrobacter wenxiniae]NVM93897.1 hypothetical protein [Arthrobacter wenxiniae]
MTALRTAHAPAGQVSRRRASTGSGGELASLCVGIAAVGMAALGSAASSSLAASLNGTAGLAAWWGWAAAIGSAGWAGTALLYAVATLRAGHLPLPGLAVRAVGVAVSVHLAGVLIGLWRVPEESRFLDVTVASLLVLELSVLALMGWQRNKAARTPSGPGAGWKPSPLGVVGTMFAASILVASVATLGLAASTAGQLAVPHSGHGSHGPGGPLPSNLEQLKHSGHHH